MKSCERDRVNLVNLGEDCLRLICAKLSLREQFALLDLHPVFKRTVLRLWHVKYQRTIDFSRTVLPLHDEKLQQLLTMLCKITRELRSMEVLPPVLLKQLSSPFVGVLSNITTIFACQPLPFEFWLRLTNTFPRLKCLHLHRQRQIPLDSFTSLDTLTHVQIINCTFEPPPKWPEFFQSLRLEAFTYLAANPQNSLEIWRSLRHAKGKLQALQLNAAPSTSLEMATTIAALPFLQELTIFISDSTHRSLPTQIVSNLRQRHLDARIIALRLKCHFDSCLLLQCTALPNLRKLSWHTHLEVFYDISSGILQWHASDPSIAKSIKSFVEICRCPLTQLDLRANCHATKKFLSDLHQAHHRRRDLPSESLQVLTDTEGLRLQQTDIIQTLLYMDKRTVKCETSPPDCIPNALRGFGIFQLSFQ